jgi:alanyl-tRNA synthetase
MRVIADHSRAVTFLICDGVLPSNEGRGYVLRRIMRRAARHAKMLGFAEPVLFRAVDAVNSIMGEAFPELIEREEYVKKVILAEEERFAETLDRGLAILNEDIAGLKSRGEKLLPGDAVFRLYDTFGFPVDLTADIMAAEGMTVDETGFELCMERQRAQAREHWKGSGEEGVADIFKKLHSEGIRSEFIGYDQRAAYSVVSGLIARGGTVQEATAGENVDLIAAASPFYGASGGQAGDRGSISTGGAHLQVVETLRPFSDLIVHRAVVESGTIKVGEAIDLKVDVSGRNATARNHTATHLLQSALRQTLGEHVKQAGSLVEQERLRFDFTHFSAMTTEEVRKVEELVNGFIMINNPVDSREMAVSEAMSSGATALFGEKYGESVRVVKVGEVSMELCGGTHVSAAGDIGFFKIVSEGGIAAGVRRIEAVTGTGAVRFVQEMEKEQNKLAGLVKAEGGGILDRVERILVRQKELQREVETLQAQLNAGKSADMLAGVREIGGVKALAAEVEVDDVRKLRELADSLKDRLGSGILALGANIGGKATLLVTVSSDLVPRFSAGSLIREMAPIIGGSGGGKPEMAQAGGSNPERLAEALGKLYTLIS